MGINRPRDGKRIVRAEWVARAVNLAIQGWSQRKIAERVGKSKTAVQKALYEEWQDRRAPAEEVETARAIMREQIDRQLRVWIPRAGKGDAHAAGVVAKCWERRAKLDGLDAPARVETNGTIRVGDLSTLTDDELRRLSQGFGLAAPGDGGARTPPPGDAEGGS